MRLCCSDDLESARGRLGPHGLICARAQVGTRAGRALGYDDRVRPVAGAGLGSRLRVGSVDQACWGEAGLSPRSTLLWVGSARTASARWRDHLCLCADREMVVQRLRECVAWWRPRAGYPCSTSERTLTREPAGMRSADMICPAQINEGSKVSWNRHASSRCAQVLTFSQRAPVRGARRARHCKNRRRFWQSSSESTFAAEAHRRALPRAELGVRGLKDSPAARDARRDRHCPRNSIRPLKRATRSGSIAVRSGLLSPVALVLLFYLRSLFPVEESPLPTRLPPGTSLSPRSTVRCTSLRPQALAAFHASAAHVGTWHPTPCAPSDRPLVRNFTSIPPPADVLH